MKNLYAIILVGTILVGGLAGACKKEDEVITDKKYLEQYTNSSGHALTVTTYIGALPANTFTLPKDSILHILTPMDPVTDTTGMILFADSAKLVFDDSKSYMLRDTVSTTVNFLDKKNFTTAVSATGQIYYYRYTISADHYNLAK